MKSIINFIINSITVYMLIDALAFMMWAMSGQHPVDGFYIGAVTTTLIKGMITIVSIIF